MKVSLCVVAYNEENSLSTLLSDIEKQTYDHSLIELVLIDSASTDGTRHIMETFQEKQNGFSAVLIRDNPKKILAAGCNIAIHESSGEVIIRVDAHARIPADFVEKNIVRIKSGEDVVGGPRPNVVAETTPWKEVLLLAESSMFGSGIASFRRKTKEKKYVKSVFHGAYRREVFEKAGVFNEKLGRTEDNELNYRIRRAGYKICYDPDIISYQYVRGTLRQMMKQKYGNGYWVGLTTGVCPKCLSVYYFVPFSFCLAFFSSGLLCFRKRSAPFMLLNVAYWSADLLMTLESVKGKEWNIRYLLLPFIFFLLHVSYGLGTLVGLLKAPFMRNKLK